MLKSRQLTCTSTRKGYVYTNVGRYHFIYLLYLIWSRNASAIKRAENVFAALSLKGQFHGFAHVQALSLAVVNFTVSY